MFYALQSLYHNVKCSVRLNGMYSSWFDVKRGLKQGCVLSPILFNLFINDVLETLNATGYGVSIDDDIIAALAYADDIILMAESEEELSKLLQVLHNWCDSNAIIINVDKSQVVHFRNPSVPRTTFSFNVGCSVLSVVSSYKYLGLLLTEHLDYHAMGNAAAKSANRALGLLISKFKTIGGMHFSTFSKLYDTMVWPCISYGASVWGSRDVSAVNAVHHRAIRFFLGVGKYAPNVAINGDTGWIPPIVRQWVCVTRQWCRFRNMHGRLNKHVFIWAERLAANRKKNWNFNISAKMANMNMQHIYNDTTRLNAKSICNSIQCILMDKYVNNWYELLHKESGKSGSNKLRTYRLFKHVYGCENYVSTCMPRSYRSAFAKFRSGTAPLKIETGRYANLQVQERVCFNCNGCVEDEAHVLLQCPLYNVFRNTLFNQFLVNIPTFLNMSNDEKMCILFQNNIYLTAKTCFLILQRRRDILYI